MAGRLQGQRSAGRILSMRAMGEASDAEPMMRFSFVRKVVAIGAIVNRNRVSGETAPTMAVALSGRAPKSSQPNHA